MPERLNNSPERLKELIQSTEYLIESALEREEHEEAVDWARLRSHYRELAGHEPDELDIDVKEFDED